MQTPEEIKYIVKEKYGKIAVAAVQENSCCCGCGCAETSEDLLGYTMMDGEYKNLDGYVPSADLALGCGIPTEFANIKIGETVLDLGSGAGNDAFIARKLVGESGKVIGLDMTPEMIKKARANTYNLGYTNVRFIEGEIENMPIQSDFVDVILSNCVLNLVPNKEKAFTEMFRVIKEGGRFCVSDIVLNGILPDGMKNAAMMYVGCVAGAMQKDEYLSAIEKAGFKNIEIKTKKPVILTDAILKDYINPNEIEYVKANPQLMESITVYAEK